jgi:protein PhnA
MWLRCASLGSTTGEEDDENKVIHRDVNGVILEVEDSLVLIRDLKSKKDLALSLQQNL